MYVRQRFYVAFASILLMLVGLSSFASAQTSGCVTCHTDEAALKSLYKPVVVEGGEGEG
jgi:hypothetical protein